MVEADEKRLNLTCSNLSELTDIATEIVEFSTGFSVLLFSGELGAGKTAVIKEVCKSKGVLDGVTSPTFAIINEYLTADGDPIFHFDFYRLKSELEISNLGLDEYFDSGHLCLVEWPERLGTHVPNRYVKIRIEAEGPESRTFELEKHE